MNFPCGGKTKSAHEGRYIVPERFQKVHGVWVQVSERDKVCGDWLCYTRCTLVGRGETKLSRGRCSRRDATSLKQLEILRSKVEGVRRSQAECLWTQEYARLRRTKMKTTVQAASYLYYGSHKHRMP